MIYGVDWQIFSLLALVIFVVIAMVREWFSPDVLALYAFSMLLLTGILESGEAFDVFSNQAPLTVAAMFILSAAIQETGSVNSLGHWMGKAFGSDIRLVLCVMMLLVGVWSAFMNNTPVVAIMMPILLSFCRSHKIAPSKLLIPLSYAAVMGGCCTLIGTSTNILVSGIAYDYGYKPLGMFDLAWIGLPILLIGTAYMVFVGRWLLPERQSITSMLAPDDRQSVFCQFLVKENSPIIGKRLIDTKLGQRGSRYKIVDVRRDGDRLMTSLDKIKIKKYDRFLIAIPLDHQHPKKGETVSPLKEDEQEMGLDNLATLQGGLIEAIVTEHSQITGKTIQEVNFRQKYGVLAMAVHRNGKNLSNHFNDITLEFGDNLLLLGPYTTLHKLRETGDYMLLDDMPWHSSNLFRGGIAWCTLLLVVAASTLGFPIAAAAFIGCCIVLLTKCLTPDKAYQSVEWPIIMLIYCMLALGVALEKTGAASLVAYSLISSLQLLFTAENMPYIALATCYLLTSIFTEFMSNNATAVVMAPIAINLGLVLGCDPYPFLIAVTIAASAAFATPIGYQTNTMVYGAGGYKFSDYMKVGIPLNILCFVVSMLVIPTIWKF